VGIVKACRKVQQNVSYCVFISTELLLTESSHHRRKIATGDHLFPSVTHGKYHLPSSGAYQ